MPSAFSHRSTTITTCPGFPPFKNTSPTCRSDSGIGPTETETSSTLSLIDASGMTLESRIHTSDGYTRTKEADGSLAEFLRNYAMEPDQSPVLLYDGSKKRNQKAHVAVFDLPLEHEDLQQCADSAIRVYAEYFWSTKQYDRIAFHFTNGFDAQYTKWADGYRIRVNGNNVSWIKSAQPDTSYDSLKDYLRIVFSYAGSVCLEIVFCESVCEWLA